MSELPRRGSIYALDLREDSELLQYTAQGFLSLFLQENLSKRALKLIMTTFKRAKCPLNRPLSALTKDQLNFVLEGNCKKRAHLQDKELTFIGLHAIIKEHIFKNFSIYETAHHLLEARTCKECQGSRLNPLARASKINGKSIVESCQMPLDQLQIFIEALTPPDSLKAVVQKINHDLTTAMSLNLKNLSLQDRSAPSRAARYKNLIYLGYSAQKRQTLYLSLTTYTCTHYR